MRRVSAAEKRWCGIIYMREASETVSWVYGVHGGDFGFVQLFSSLFSLSAVLTIRCSLVFKQREA